MVSSIFCGPGDEGPQYSLLSVSPEPTVQQWYMGYGRVGMEPGVVAAVEFCASEAPPPSLWRSLDVSQD